MVNIIVISSTWAPQSGEYKESIILYSDNWNDYGYYTLFHLVYYDEQGLLHEIGSLKIYSKVLDEPGNVICSVGTLLPNKIERNPLIECFGDNISNIISDIFDVTEIESYHKQVLKKLSDQIPEEEVYKLFNEHLSIDAKIYLKTLYRGNHND